MAIGSWSPDDDNQTTDFSIEQSDLELIAGLASDEALEQLESKLSNEEQQRLSALLTQSTENWNKALQHTQLDLLWPLIRFFTVAEMKLAGWQCGNDSPVIKINRYLKSQQQPLSKEQLLWIRNNSNNRYIPNGSIL